MLVTVRGRFLLSSSLVAHKTHQQQIHRRNKEVRTPKRVVISIRKPVLLPFEAIIRINALMHAKPKFTEYIYTGLTDFAL